MVCSLGIPTVFVDGFARAGESLLHCDIVSMENIASEMALVRHMVSGGAKRLGFVGDIEHCNSFYERWVAFGLALGEAGIPVDRDLCILEEDSMLYEDTKWLLQHLESMPQMPDAFVCANDYLAIHLIAALKQKGLSVPDDVMVSGFDGSLESTLIDPSLTTAQIPSSDIGRLAAGVLADRIRHPKNPYRWVNVKTTPVWGASTR